MSDRADDPTAAPSAPEPSPARADTTSSLDRTLLLATAAIAFVAALLLAAVLVIESGFEQLREEAFPLSGEREASGRSGPEPVRSALPAMSEASEPTAFLGLDLEHPLSSGLLAIYVDDRLVHEETLSSRPRRVLVFRMAPQGDVRVSVPVDPGLRRIRLQIRADELPMEATAEATAEFREHEWRLLIARLRPDQGLLQTRWGQ